MGVACAFARDGRPAVRGIPLPEAIQVTTFGPMADDEPIRAARLLDAQAKAERLFAEIEKRGLIAPGRGRAGGQRPGPGPGERAVRHDPALAQADRALRAEHAEALPGEPAGPGDRARTTSCSPTSARSSRSTRPTSAGPSSSATTRSSTGCATTCRRSSRRAGASSRPTPEITGARLYAERRQRWRRRPGGSWAAGTPGTWSASSRTSGSTARTSESYITPANTTPLRRTDKAGRRCHWILEIHLIDREREFGGFHEELLTL